MRERNGVRVGQAVRDLDGTELGRVKELYDGGFSVVRGFPILFWKDAVLRYDEVRGVRDGDLVVARSRKDIFDQARGRLPASWRIPAPSGFPTAATPSEARAVFDVVAAPRPPGAPPRELPPQAVAALAASRGESLIWHPEDAEPAAPEERTAAGSRSQDLGANAPAHH